VLVVEDGDLSNSVVFASRGKLLDRGRTVRCAGRAHWIRPPAAQLSGAFTQVRRALHTRRSAEPPAT
jgi:hypothetical protein